MLVLQRDKCAFAVVPLTLDKRKRNWSNRAYVDYDDLRFAAIEAWQKAALDPEIIKSVCRAKYAERNY